MLMFYLSLKKGVSDMIDLYFSYRSPYSYFILPRMLKLKNEYNVDVNFKIVYPIAIRLPEFFKDRNLFYFTSLMMDIKRKAKKLNMTLNLPIKPEPIKNNYSNFLHSITN